MSEGENLIVEMAERLFRDLADPQTVNAATDDRWRDELWAALEETELTRAWVGEAQGGAGAGGQDIMAIAQLCGRYALSVPLIETLLAGRLLSLANLTLPHGAATIAPATLKASATYSETAGLAGSAGIVPFLGTVAWLVVVAANDDGREVVCLVPASAVTFDSQASLGGDAQAKLQFDGVRPEAVGVLPTAAPPGALVLAGAALRAGQMAGALEALVEITTAYAGERVAFGRPIAKFQAIQHALVRLAGEAAAAVTAAKACAWRLEPGDNPGETPILPVAAAKIRVGEAAAVGAGIAHQTLGAMGFTGEHILHRFTHRLWTWRDDFGSEAEWALRLGREMLARGVDDYWPALVDQADPPAVESAAP